MPRLRRRWTNLAGDRTLRSSGQYSDCPSVGLLSKGSARLIGALAPGGLKLIPPEEGKVSFRLRISGEIQDIFKQWDLQAALAFEDDGTKKRSEMLRNRLTSLA